MKKENIIYFPPSCFILVMINHFLTKIVGIPYIWDWGSQRKKTIQFFWEGQILNLIVNNQKKEPTERYKINNCFFYGILVTSELEPFNLHIGTF